MRAWVPYVCATVGLQSGIAASIASFSSFPGPPPLVDCLETSVAFLILATIAVLGLDAAVLYRSPTSLRDALASWRRRDFASPIVGMVLLGVLMAFANWSKSMIPFATGFTKDVLLADLDHAIFGIDPWHLFRIPALVHPYALAYVYWFPISISVLLALLFSKPSHARDSSLVSFFGIFLIGGTIGHFAGPSAGPIFYQRIGLGNRFAEMVATNDPTYTLFADYLWHWHLLGQSHIGTGISAMPSMHVAVSCWLIFACRSLWMPLTGLGVLFWLTIWAASIASGWHYATDGLVGSVLAVSIHYVARRLIDYEYGSATASGWRSNEPATKGSRANRS